MRLSRRAVLGVALTGLLLASCDGDPVADAGPPDATVDAAPVDGGAPGPVSPVVQYASAELYDAPWPDERLRRADGRVGVSAFPNPRGVRIVEQLVTLLEDAAGFGVSSTIFFPMTGGLDPASLPDVFASIAPGASVFLMDVDPDSATRGALTPVDVAFTADPGPHGARDLLAVLPLQGRPLYPNRLYAAVVTTSVRGTDGDAIEPAEETQALLRGERPDGMSEAAFVAHGEALAGLRAAGIEDADVAATAVFRTWDPAAELLDARTQVLARPIPIPDPAFEALEVFDDYCVFRTTVDMPDFQTGTPPYAEVGGAWAYDADGALVAQREARSNLYVTVPRRAMPPAGFPAAVFVRTGGGGDRPLVDRGPRSVTGGMADVPGTGPALHFARAGFAGVSVDGPLGGLRNPDGWDEQFAVFNINNPEGLEGAIRQSALELMLLTRILGALSFDASSCPDLVTPLGDGAMALDLSTLTLMGHSMGATIAPLVVALEPAYRALILSGAGGSWIENVVFKEGPVHVRPIAEGLLRYTTTGRTLTEHDPALALLQWAGETADPQVYARAIVDEPTVGAPRHVLMFQGILDTYIPPPVANPLTLALGIDLAGGALDEALSDRFGPLTPWLPLSGGTARTLPLSGNRAAGASTAVLVQHDEDGIEDGHEVVFQTDGPALQYGCFLASLASGAPTVPARDAPGCD